MNINDELEEFKQQCIKLGASTQYSLIKKHIEAQEEKIDLIEYHNVKLMNDRAKQDKKIDLIEYHNVKRIKERALMDKKIAELESVLMEINNDAALIGSEASFTVGTLRKIEEILK